MIEECIIKSVASQNYIQGKSIMHQSATFIIAYTVLFSSHFYGMESHALAAKQYLDENTIHIKFNDQITFALSQETVKKFDILQAQVELALEGSIQIGPEFIQQNHIEPKHFLQLVAFTKDATKQTFKEKSIPLRAKDVGKVKKLASFLCAEESIEADILTYARNDKKLESYLYNQMYNPKTSSYWQNVIQAPVEEKLTAIQAWKQWDEAKQLYDELLADLPSVKDIDTTKEKWLSDWLSDREIFNSIHDIDIAYTDNANKQDIGRHACALRLIELPRLTKSHIPLVRQLLSLEPDHLDFNYIKECTSLALEPADILAHKHTSYRTYFEVCTITSLPVDLLPTLNNTQMTFEKCILSQDIIKKIKTLPSKKEKIYSNKTRYSIYQDQKSFWTHNKLWMVAAGTLITGFSLWTLPTILEILSNNSASLIQKTFQETATPAMLPVIQHIIQQKDIYKPGLTFLTSALKDCIPQTPLPAHITSNPDIWSSAYKLLKSIAHIDNMCILKGALSCTIPSASAISALFYPLKQIFYPKVACTIEVYSNRKK